jgi:PAS domain S-box-containing protein
MGGIDFYGDVLFTTERFVKKNPDLTEHFVEASLKGWTYAMENPDEIIDLIYNKYSQRHSKEHLKFESEKMTSLIMSNVVELGYSNPGRWESIFKIYQRLNMVDEDVSSNILIYPKFLEVNQSFPWKLMLIFLLIILVISFFSVRTYRNAQRLKVEINKRKDIEQDLKNEELANRMLFMHSPDAYLIIIDGIFVDCNVATEKMLGGSREQIVGKSPRELSPENQPNGQNSDVAAKEKIRYALTHGHNTFEWSHLSFSGNEILVEVSIAVMELEGKKALFTTWRDITERKAVEKALIENERDYRLLFEEHSAIKLILKPETGDIINANQAASNFYGWSRERLKKMNVRDVSVLSEEKIQAEMAQILLRKQVPSEYKHKKSDGSIRDVDVFSNVITMKGEKYIHSIIIDITERKNAERALQESEEKFRQMADMLPQIVFETDIYGKLTYVNKQAYAILGYPYNYDIKDFNTIDLYIPEDQPRAIANIKRKTMGEHDANNEYTMRKYDGSLINVLVYSVPIFKEQKIVGVRGLIIDNTQQKKSEREIQQKNAELHKMNAEKDKFFSIIAHDLKSPFNSIVGFSEILLEHVQRKDYQGIEKFSDIILTSSNRAMDLLVNLMEWSRSQTGRMNFNPEYCEMVQLVTEITLLFSDISKQKSITIVSRLPDNFPIYADKAMISIVLRNLISNAIKFSYPRGIVTVAGLEKEKYYEFSISDTGVGLQKKQLDKLFTIDENTSTPGTHDEKGTGLGLVLCKDFVSLHGGKIWVESQPDKGSTFYFTIPIRH